MKQLDQPSEETRQSSIKELITQQQTWHWVFFVVRNTDMEFWLTPEKLVFLIKMATSRAANKKKGPQNEGVRWFKSGINQSFS